MEARDIYCVSFVFMMLPQIADCEFLSLNLNLLTLAVLT